MEKQKRIRTLFIAATLLVSTVYMAFGQPTAESANAAVAVATVSVTAKLTRSLTPTEFAAWANRHAITPTEILFEDGGLQGGLTLAAGENVSRAVTRLVTEHRRFLTVALANADRGLTTAATPVARNELLALRSQFKNAETRLNGGQFKLSSMVVTDGSNIRALERSGIISLTLNAVALPSAEPRETTSTSETTRTPISLTHESWAPSRGSSDITRGWTYQTFSFNNIAAFDSAKTYEHETQIYDTGFANYSGYWSSSLPSAYIDTRFLDSVTSPGVENFTVGTSRASLLRANTLYYTYIGLRTDIASHASADIRIKGQLGNRRPATCYSTWCIFAQATSGTIVRYFAPGVRSWTY
ncbi:MAG: hypothetical protein V1738_01270 [Patescibacteria group bacterium]